VNWDVTTFAKSPEKYEGGTPPIGEAIGLGAAIDFINEIGWENMANQEKKVAELVREELGKLPWVRIYSGGGNVIAFNVEGVHPHDVAEILGNNGVAVRAGHHCAMSLHQKLGVEATARISLGIYNDEEEVEKLVIALKKVWTTFIGK
jgi:cysteine desulfurase/selenocysteine lyase